ncbi:MAG: DUF2851 family protein [Bacteroidales bacterium]|jgi:hypothetical protein|nr:DUF2851 family protein [Bacteroidales bacterium]
MTEDFLQYIWQHSLYLPDGNLTTEGETVEPLQPGQANIHAGPDFTDTRVRIGDTVWAGCVEIHLRSSDWERHGHHTDPAYNNVVLHVVYQHDADTYNARRQKIPVMELHFDPRYYDNYTRLADSKTRIACHDRLDKVDTFGLTSWLERLAIERLEQKAGAIMQTYAATDSNWEETLYQRLARNFGFGLNALPFESLARSLPLNILLKRRDNRQQVEALLFGQAGMLADENITDAYYAELRKEYLYLQKKYSLEPVNRFLWKFLRLRPINFPTLRIAQFAALIYRNDHLFSQIIEAESTDTFEKLFDLQASAYWDTHYVFGKDSLKRNKSFGKTAIRTILINTIVPFLFVYGKARGKDEFCARAVNLLESLPSEKNSILTQWEKLGIHNPDAFTSQALLQLANEYCRPKRCLSCAIGNRIIRN